MSDQYNFEKSKSQDVQSKTPYENRVFNFINDQNNGNYVNNSLSLVQFDLGSIYNQAYFVEDFYLAVPIVMMYSGVGSTITGLNASSVLSLKNGGWNLVDKCEIEINGVVIEQMQNWTNIITNFKMMSQMSQADLVQYGSMLKFPQLDSVNSMEYLQASGITNNFILGNSQQSVVGGPVGIGVGQNSGCTNDRLTKSINSVLPVNALSTNKFASLTSQSQASQEGRSTFNVTPNAVYGTYSDVVIIRLKDILSSFGALPLCKKVAGNLRLYLNTGSVLYTQSASASIGPLASFSASNSTFSTTCPITINSTIKSGQVVPIFAATVTQIVAGLFIGTAPTTNIAGVNFGNAEIKGNQTFTSCRLYYSQVQLKPRLALEYVSANREKLCTYNTFLSTQVNSINAGATYSQLVQSGIVNLKGIVIIPFVSSSVLGFNQYASPADTSPSTFGGPLSLTQLNVQRGGINILNVPMQYTFAEYYEQISQWENIVNDFGMPVGLMTSEFWNNARVYYIDCSRVPADDLQVAQNLVVNFTNNNTVAIDVLIFTIKGDQFILNVENGSIRKN